MHWVALNLHKAHTYILYDWGSSKFAYCMHHNTIGVNGVAVNLHKAHTYILYDWGSSKFAYCMHMTLLV